MTDPLDRLTQALGRSYRIERERQLPIPDAVRMAREIASALDDAHR